MKKAQLIVRLVFSLALLLFPIFSQAIIEAEDLIDGIKEYNIDYLYISNPKQIDNLDTVTYFFSYLKVDQRIFEVFYRFSEEMGKSHGGIILTPTDDNYHVYLKKMLVCKPPTENKLPTIFFEDRNLKKCFEFPVTDERIFFDILSYINEHIDTYKFIKKSSIHNNFKEYKEFQINKIIIYEFIDYLINLIK